MGRKRKTKKINIWQLIFSAIIVICILFYEYVNKDLEIDNKNNNYNVNNSNIANSNIVFDLSTIPEYTGNPYVEINNNIPYFTEEDFTLEPFENYNDLGDGKAGVAMANICKEIMPKEGEERGEIGSVKDLSGWVQKRYDNLIKDKYLYNRCHLIGWQLAGENANKNNLITGTRYLNTEGMLPFENMVAEYIANNENSHVLYRVTPIFEGANKLASGVEMEACSVEDKGDAIKFNVYCYNVQPGIVIDYATGESHEK